MRNSKLARLDILIIAIAAVLKSRNALVCLAEICCAIGIIELLLIPIYEYRCKPQHRPAMPQGRDYARSYVSFAQAAVSVFAMALIVPKLNFGQLLLVLIGVLSFRAGQWLMSAWVSISIARVDVPEVLGSKAVRSICAVFGLVCYVAVVAVSALILLFSGVLAPSFSMLFLWLLGGFVLIMSDFIACILIGNADAQSTKVIFWLPVFGFLGKLDAAVFGRGALRSYAGLPWLIITYAAFGAL